MAVNFRRLGLSQESGPRPIGPGSQSRGPRRAEPSPEMDLLSDRKWSRRTSGCCCEGVVCCPNMNPELPQGRRSSEPPRPPPNVCGVNRKQLLRQPPPAADVTGPRQPPLAPPCRVAPVQDQYAHHDHRFSLFLHNYYFFLFSSQKPKLNSE